MRLRNSVGAELILLACVYIFGLWLCQGRVEIGTATWYADAGWRWAPAPAGIWYVFVSIPIVQFILLRWYMRFLIWFRFLCQVSRINLNLIPSHPDRCAGIAFLGKTSYAFGPILFAQGALLAGLSCEPGPLQGRKLAIVQVTNLWLCSALRCVHTGATRYV